MLVQTWSRIGMVLVGVVLACSLAHAEGNRRPTGLAIYTDTARDIYIAGLYLPEGQDPETIDLSPGPISMEYRIASRRISSRSFSGTLLLQAEFGSGERASEKVISALEDLKQRIQGALLQGDQFRITLTESRHTSFHLNGEELLTLGDESIFDFLISGWIGDSSSALFRNSLLSGKTDPGLMMQYESLLPSAERIVAVAEWSAAPDKAEGPVVVENGGEAAASTTTVVAAVIASETAAGASEITSATAAAAVEALPPQMPEKSKPAAAAKQVAVVESVEAATESKANAPAKTNAKPNAKPNAAKSKTSGKQLAMLKKEEPKVVPLSAAEEIPVKTVMDDREYKRQLRLYVGQVMSKVFSQVRYPRRAIEKEREGNVELLAHFDEGGELMKVTLELSSGYGPLDKAALKAVRKAAPFPELTNVAREEFITEDGVSYMMTIPVKFMLQE